MFKLVALPALLVAASVPESDFYPIIEYWRAGDFRPNQLCGTSASAAQVDFYPSRPSAGLIKWSKSLLDLYSSQARNLGTKDLSYAARQRRKTSDWDTLVAASIQGAIANARGGSSGASFANMFCENTMKSVTPEQFCYAMGNFSQSTQCLTDYTYRDSVKVSRALTPSNDYGWTLPSECLGPISANRYPLDLGIQRFSYTPDSIDNNVVSAEGKVYYLLWKAIDHLNRFAEAEYLLALSQIAGDGETKVAPKVVKKQSVGIHDLFRNDRVFEQILPEWEVKKVIMMNEARFLNGPTLRTPFGIIAQRGADVLVVFRRSVTTFDQRLALYNQQSLKFLYNFTGEVHDGSSTIFQTLSGVLEFSFDTLYEAIDLSKVQGPVTVTFAAADLPASGGAVILASHMQKVLSEKFGGSENVQINAVVFGTDMMSDKSFVDKVRRTIEVRTIQIEGDSTDLFPCPRTYSCDERVLLPRTGIETGKEYTYAPLPGKVTVPMSNLARYDSVWKDESTLLQLGAIKDCAYSCYLAKSVCPSDPDHRCSKRACPSFV